jgi:hypothetical protein
LHGVSKWIHQREPPRGWPVLLLLAVLLLAVLPLPPC